jgi:hypothetical protein
MRPNTVFGFSRNGIAIVLTIAALFLVAVVGLLLLGVGAVKALIFADADKGAVPASALLVAIIVLLVAVFILLLLLLWCCCRSANRKDTSPDLLTVLLPLVPLLPQIRLALRDTAIALHEGGKALTWIRENLGGNVSGSIDSAGDLLINVAGTVGHFQIPTPPYVDTEYIGARNNAGDEVGPKVYKVTRLHGGETVTLESLKNALNNAGAALKTHGQDIDRVVATMNTAGRTVGTIAAALGSPPPTEVTQ